MTPLELKTLRKEMGLTQRALAERLGVKQVTLRKWERGPERGRLNRIPQPVERLLKIITAATLTNATP